MSVLCASMPASNAPASFKYRLTVLFEIFGSVLAMAYPLLIASNTGFEVIGFSLLLISSALFAGWALIDRRWTFLLLQLFYSASAVIGLIRWG
ncbi:MAG: hypothetical protein ACU0BB_17395 [Paracoccaceae bacterium]